MRRLVIAALAAVEALVFCGIVRYSLELGRDLQRPRLAERTALLLARALDQTQREIAQVGVRLRRAG